MKKVIFWAFAPFLLLTQLFAESSADTGYSSAYQGYQIFLVLYFILMIYTVWRGAGENRTLIIFKDYNDLGLTFMIPAVAILIYIVFTAVGGDPRLAVALSAVLSIILFVILVRNTYIINERKLSRTILSLLTKIPLSLIWIISFVTMLKPSGATAAERRSSRGTAMIVLFFLTPIIGLVVAEKEGSLFNPKSWIRGRRVGGLRNHL